MTSPGIYTHFRTGDSYRVLHCARNSTNGPDDGRLVVVYISLKYGTFHVRDEEQFNEPVEPPPERGFDPGVKIPRFMFTGEPMMSDVDAESLYDGLLSLVKQTESKGE